MKKTIKVLGGDPIVSSIIKSTAKKVRDSEVVAIFERLCPNCDWKIPSFRLESDLACVECIPESIAANYYGVKGINPQIKLGQLLEESKSLIKFRNAYYVEKELEEFSKFFEELVGSPPWSAQRVWARRVLSGQSFAIIAPTGVGKTVFGIVMALYLAHKKGLRTYIVLPTKTLLRQVLEKIREWEEKIGVSYSIGYSSELGAKARREFDERLKAGNFKILITTSQFLIRNLLDILNAFQKAGGGMRSFRYVDFMFVDDVDSFLRNVKNLDRAITLLGYNRTRRMRMILEKIRRMGVRTKAEGREGVLTEEDWDEIFNTRGRAGILVVSSATGRVKGILLRRLFTYIFGFSIGSSKEGIRNVLDAYDDSLLNIKVTREILIERAIHFAKKLGSGGLIFIARGPDSDEILSEIVSKLEREGIKAIGVSAEEGTEVVKAVEKFAKGEVDILVGKASPYGLLVRGLDLPERVRYAVFVKVPQFSIRLEKRPHPFYLSFVLRKIANVFEDKIQLLDEIRELASNIVLLRSQDISAIENDARRLIEEKGLDQAIKYVEELTKEDKNPRDKVLLLTLRLTKRLDEILKDGELINKLEKAGVPFEVREENGLKYISLLSADIKTYIQASGRTSRLYAGGITRGLSIILPDNKNLLEELDRKLLWTVEVPTVPLSEIDLDDILKEIDADRERVRIARLGKMPAKEHLQTCLFVVESPTKARTIASFFGRPTRRILPGAIAYEIIIGKYLATIVATIGHITDLITHRFIPKLRAVKRGDHYVLEISEYRIRELSWPYGVPMVKWDSEYRFIPIFGPKVTCAKCGYVFVPYITINEEMADEVIERKIKKLKRILRRPEERPIFLVFRRTPKIPLKCPRCGETEELYDKEVTIDTLRHLALESEVVVLGTDPDIEGEKIAWDIAILLKPFAKKIMRIEFHEVTRSAIERALANPREINMDLVKGQLLRRIEDRWIGFYLSEELKDLLGERNLSAGRVQSPVLSWIVERYNLWKQKEKWTIINIGGDAEIRIQGEIKVDHIIVNDIVLEDKKIIPPPPLVTDTLLRYASILFGLSADKTMKLAQSLFEVGLVTYIRTDSTRVSDAGIMVARRIIRDNFGELLFSPRRWSKGEEGAHECIRPTRPLMLNDLKEALERGEIILPMELPGEAFNLYDMITRIFVASQMKEAMAKYATLKLKIKLKEPINGKTYLEEEVSGVVKWVDSGFLRALTKNMVKLFTPRKIPLPEKGEIITCDKMKIEIAELPKSWPLTEGEIVRLMRERGIGRPSTYATIIEKLFERRYIKRQGGFVLPKERGIVVNRIVNELHRDMVSEERTRIVFERIDEVASRRRRYLESLKEIFDEIMKERDAVKSKRLPPEIINQIEKYRRDMEKRFG